MPLIIKSKRGALIIILSCVFILFALKEIVLQAIPVWFPTLVMNHPITFSQLFRAALHAPSDGDVFAPNAVERGMKEMPKAQVIPVIRSALLGNDNSSKELAAFVLGSLRWPEFENELLICFRSSSGIIKAHCGVALARIPAHTSFENIKLEIKEGLFELAGCGDAESAHRAIIGIGELTFQEGDFTRIQHVIDSTSSKAVRIAAERVLASKLRVAKVHP